MTEPIEISSTEHQDKVAQETIVVHHHGYGKDAAREALLAGAKAEAEESGAEQATPASEPGIQDILDAWNGRFPEDNRILDAQGLDALVRKESYTDEEFLIVQTMLSFLIDSQAYSAGLHVLHQVAVAFLKRAARAAGKGQKSSVKRQKFLDQAKEAERVLTNLTLDIQVFNIDTLKFLAELNSGDNVTDILSEFLDEIDVTVEEELKERKAKSDAEDEE